MNILSGVSFDNSVNLGALINAAVLVIGFVVAFTRIGGRLDLLSLRVEGVEKAVTNTQAIDKRVITLEERVANQGTQITNIQSELMSLRKGEGFITGHRRGIDGEYDR